MSSSDNHAIVFGAGGLLGWAVLNQLLSGYPSPGSFSRVTAVMNRPVAESDLQLPESSGRPAFQMASGVNLLSGTAEDLATALKDKVPSVGTVTHVFCFVFAAHNEDHIQECQMNVDMVRRVAGACSIVAPNFTSLVYPGGARGYGIYIPGGTFTPPLTETLADNLPEDYAKTVAYPWIRKALTEASAGQRWTWTEICPDAVVGFSPNGSGFSLALHWAQYLSLYAHNHGASAEVPFPGSVEGMGALFTPVSGPTLGRLAVYAALHPDRCGARILNVADADAPTTFRALWPAIAAWFGLVGRVDGSTSGNDALKPGEYVAAHRHVFEEQGLGKALTCGVGAGSAQLDAVGWWLSFDRQLSLERLRSTGFTEARAPIDGWIEAFEAFRAAGIIM